MSTSDPEFYEAPKFTPRATQELPRQRGCFFYGCLIASTLAVLMVVTAGIGAYFAYRFVNQMIRDYTASAPRELPRVKMAPEERQALKDHVEAFRKAVEEGTPTEPLTLTSDDINALIDDDEDLKGTIHVKIDGDEVKGQVSIPLEKLNVGMVRGRYLNGEADLKASLSDGVLIVTLDAIEVNGKRPPEEIMKGIRTQNLAKDIYKEEKTARTLRKIESLEVKDGKIILRVRAKGATTPESNAAQKEVPAEIVAPSSNGVPKSEPAQKFEPAQKGTLPAVEPPKAETPPAAVEKPAPKS